MIKNTESALTTGTTTGETAGESSSDTIGYDLRIKLKFGDELIGPGVIKFLELADATGSIREACEDMGMAYSKGWKILKNAEKAVGLPLPKRTAGGSGGGGSSLTDEGRKLVNGYKAFAAAVDKLADECFTDVFGN